MMLAYRTNNGVSPSAQREYIRHPEDIPIDVYIQPEPVVRKISLVMEGVRGISFPTNVCLPEGLLIRVTIPMIQPSFSIVGRVMWCQKRDDGFAVGLELVKERDAYRLRMIEQICHIEHYRRSAMAKEGRKLSNEEAAREWIGKYAKDFPVAEEPATCH